MATTHEISFEHSVEFLKFLAGSNLDLELDSDKNSIICYSGEEKSFEFKLPLPFPPFTSESVDEYYKIVSDSSFSYLIILIQAGASALGYFEGGELLYHKVIKKYMVRKKQGKSQIKHLNSKGKSRLGSRIRLRNSVLFFEEINEKLLDWEVEESTERVLLSCPINLQALYFSSNTPPFFEKRDERVRKIPIDVNVPCFKELLRVDYIGKMGKIVYTENFNGLKELPDYCTPI